MTRVSVADAKNRFSELLARVEAGEEISVTRHGKPIVRLVAIQAQTDAESRHVRVAQALRRLAELRQGVRLEGDLKAIAREGLD